MTIRSISFAVLVALSAFVPSDARSQNGDSTAASSTAATSSSWTADRRRFAIGDIITVLVDERTIASADRMTFDAQDRRNENRLRAGGGMGSGRGSSADVSLTSGSYADSEERGQARRSDRFTAEVSVRVVSVEGGVLRVEGSKKLLIDKQEQTLSISGLIRPQDVTRDNVVDSWRLSDTRLAYVSNGSMGKPKRSFLGRIFGIIWP